jgi:hypothetical protein
MWFFTAFPSSKYLPPSVFHPFLTPKRLTIKQPTISHSPTNATSILPITPLPITNQRHPLPHIKQSRLMKNNRCPTLRVRHPYFDNRITFLFDCAILIFFSTQSSFHCFLYAQ